MTNRAYAKNNGDGLLCSILCHGVNAIEFQIHLVSCEHSLRDQLFKFIKISLKNKVVNVIMTSYEEKNMNFLHINSRSPKTKLIYAKIRYCTYRSKNTTHSYSVL